MAAGVTAEAEVPVLPDLQRALPPPQGMPGEEALYSGEQRRGSGRGVIRKVVRQRLVSERRRHGSGLKEGLDFRCEGQRPVWRVHVVQRLDAEAIARQKQLLLAAVPDRECKHASQPVHRAGTLLLIQAKDGLGVTAGAVAVAASLQGGAKVEVVVDLAVVHDVERSGLVVHRLLPTLHVDDRQATMRQSRARLAEQAGTVGAPVGHHIPHPDQVLDIHLTSRRRRQYDTADPTHQSQLTVTGAVAQPATAVSDAPTATTPFTTTRSAPSESTTHRRNGGTSTCRSEPSSRAARRVRCAGACTSAGP